MTSLKERTIKAIKRMFGIVWDEPKVEMRPISWEVASPTLGEKEKGSGSYGYGGKTLSVGEIWNYLSTHIESKNKLHTAYNEFRKLDLVESLLNKVKNDILQKGRSQSQPLINISYEGNREIEGVIQSQVKNFRLDYYIEDVLFDLLLFGEYNLFIDYEHLEMDDRYEYNDLLILYSRGVPAKCLSIKSTTEEPSKSIIVKGEDEGSNSNLIDPLQILTFALPGTKMKLEVYDESNNRYFIKLPTPFISPNTIETLNILLLLEKLIPITQLIKMDKGQLLTVSVPPGTQITEMFNIVKEYESRLNSRGSILETTDVSMNFNVGTLLNYFGKYKVVPSLGDKGQMDVRELPQPGELGMDNLDYIVRTLASRLNVPSNYLLYGSTEDSPKQVLNYLNRVKSIREGLATSVRQMLLNFFVYRLNRKYSMLKIDPNKLKVTLPEVPGTESLDSIDYVDALSGTLSNIYRNIEDFRGTLEGESSSLNKFEIAKAVNAKLHPILGIDVFNVKVFEPKISSPSPTETISGGEGSRIPVTPGERKFKLSGETETGTELSPRKYKLSAELETPELIGKTEVETETWTELPPRKYKLSINKPFPVSLPNRKYQISREYGTIIGNRKYRISSRVK